MLNYREDNRKTGFGKFTDFLKRHVIAIVIIIFVIAGLVASLIIYKDQNAKKAGSGDSTTVLQKEDTVYLAIPETESFNILASDDQGVYDTWQLLYSSLFTFEDDLNIKPELVDSYKADTEGGTVEIKLKDGLKFSDGTPITSQDVRYTVEAIKDIGSKSPYYYMARKIDSVDVSDNQNFTVVFDNANDAALDNLIFPIVSSNDYKEKENFSPTSGPYAYGDYVEGNTLNLVANKNYYGTKPVNNVQLAILKNYNFRMNLMTMDAVTAMMYTGQDGDTLAKDKDLKYEKVVSSELEFLGYNYSKAYLSDKNVRKAIGMSINVKEIIKDNYGDSATQSDSIFYPGFLGAYKNDGIPYDVAEAAKLLKKGGLKDGDKNGNLDDGKKDLDLKLMVSKDNTSRVDTANNIADQLSKVGLKVTVVPVSQEDFESKLKKKDYDLYLAGIRCAPQFELNELFASGNRWGYTDTKVTSQVFKLEFAMDAEQQTKTFKEIKKTLNEEVPYFPICYKDYYFISVDTLKTKVKPTFFNNYKGCPEWTWEKRVTTENKNKNDKSNEKNAE